MLWWVSRIIIIELVFIYIAPVIGASKALCNYLYVVILWAGCFLKGGGKGYGGMVTCRQIVQVVLVWGCCIHDKFVLVSLYLCACICQCFLILCESYK